MRVFWGPVMCTDPARGAVVQDPRLLPEAEALGASQPPGSSPRRRAPSEGPPAPRGPSPACSPGRVYPSPLLPPGALGGQPRPATPGPLPALAPPTSAPPHWLRPCSAQEWTGGAGRRGCALEPPCPLPDPQSLFERQGLPGPEKLPGSLRKGIPRTKSVGTRGGARRGEAGQGGCTLA